MAGMQDRCAHARRLLRHVACVHWRGIRGRCSGTLAAALLALALAPPVVQAEPLSVPASASMAEVLASQVGKRVSVQLRTGEELTGVVRFVGDRIVVIGELAGREYFDAAVAVDAVAAVIVRTAP